MKKFFTILIAFLLVIVGFIVWSKVSAPAAGQSRTPSNLVSANGIHRHPQLEIYFRGEKQEIPANIGLGAVHQPMHTHAEDSARGIIHLEFGSIVREDDLRLGRFFSVWGKEMRSLGANMKMSVNGKENTEYEEYIMRDQDKVELRYE